MENLVVNDGFKTKLLPLKLNLQIKL